MATAPPTTWCSPPPCPLGLQLVSATVESSEPSPKRRLAAAGTCTTVGATANCTLLVVQAGGTASMVITATASGVGTQIVPAGLTFKAYKGAPITKSGSLQVTVRGWGLVGVGGNRPCC